MIEVKLKRIFDIIFALLLIILTCWLLLIISFIIKMESKGKILFRQKRIGRLKNEFYILKFRTMRSDTPNDVPTHELQGANSYITPFGSFLRKTSLDELPQLINILRGEMSFVGPRPALWNQFDLIEERDKYGANDVYPGITGWAQINGRDELPIPVKAKLDGEYVKNWSLRFDLICLIRTVRCVFKQEGIKEGA